MFPSWYKTARRAAEAQYHLAMLAAESQQVIWLRMLKLAAGGMGAQREAELMVSEKVAAATQATSSLAMGASPNSVVKRYRTKVRANARRLSK
jgi:hypothetical protein